MASAALLLASCGGGGSAAPAANGGQTPAPSPAATATTASGCSLRARQNWALTQLNEWYLFPSLFNAAANPGSYSDLGSYVDALVQPARAQNRDRYFTYVTSITEENAYYSQGATAGYGFRLSYDSATNRVQVSEAFEGAPALAGGIDRGAELLQINSQSVAGLMASGGSAAVVQALGPDAVGTTRAFVFRDASGVERTATLSKASYSLDPISDRYGTRIITDGARRVGYVNLRNFIDRADPDLRAAFASFRAQGVTELIIDLRYNGGGLISIAELMGDLMGMGRTGQVFDYISYRDSKASEGSSRTIRIQPESIAPTKIAFIGTGSTASASEMVINGMVPFLRNNMALIGSNTYGKPVGQIALDRSECDDRLRAIALKVENSEHQGEYYNGLATTVPTTCRASDDITHPLGEPNEAMTRAALDFLAGRACTSITAVTTQSLGRRLIERETPATTAQYEMSGAF